MGIVGETRSGKLSLTDGNTILSTASGIPAGLAIDYLEKLMKDLEFTCTSLEEFKAKKPENQVRRHILDLVRRVRQCGYYPAGQYLTEIGQLSLFP